jgi:class 3 adenylate cyclase
MRCPHCQHENREGARFCAACGRSFASKCPACGSEPPLGAVFCDHCGTPLTGTTTAAAPPPLAPRPQTPQAYTPTHLAEKILTSRAALEGERKQVTVLFADLKGSMELLADRDPEDARAILDPVLERMMAAVHRYEGTVNQVMGDGIMALFGAPVAHEDHAVRACYAALAMQASVKQYAAEVQRTNGVPIHIRVGLNSGEVVVRSIGSDLHMDYTAVGQTTHLAARMEQMAMPGSVLMTAEVLRLAEGYVQVEPLGPLPIKGLQELAEVYEVTGAGPARTRLFPEREYTFKHALTHDVAYGSLLLERRRALHAGIVEGLQRLYPDRLAEHVDRMAHHALRGEVWEKALIYCRQAGEKALERSAYRDAVGYFEQALTALPHLPEQREMHEQAIDLRLALRSALFPSGDSERILGYLHEAETLAAALDDPRRLGHIFNFLSVHFRNMGAYDQAIAASQRALAFATASEEVVLHALANQRLGLTYQSQGDYRRAIDCLLQSVASLHGAQRRERLGQANVPSVQSLAYLAACHGELGLFAEGSVLGEEGLQIAETVADHSSLMWALYGMGLLSLCQGDLPKALPLLDRAMGICQDSDLLLFVPRMAAALGTAYILLGRVADAVALLTPAMEQISATDMAGFQALCSLPLGEAQLLAGRLKEAHTLAERTLTHARQHQERSNQAYALRLLGDIATHRDPPEVEEAEAYYRQALALTDALGMRPLRAHCHRSLGTLYAATGQRAQARTELKAAIESYRAMEMTFWLPQAEAALAQVEGR